MSAPAAGKYQDHYFVLGIDPKSDSETIQKAYAKLAEVYNPKNRETGDAEKFEALNLAYEVLSDPELRTGFDQLKGVGGKQDNPKFSGAGFFEALGRESLLRSAILCILFDRRRTKPLTPGLSMRQLENMLETTSDELSSALWYLKQRLLVRNDDKSNLLISVEGVDFLENKQATPAEILPLIKKSALAGAPASADKPGPSMPEAESVLSVLSRIRTRA